MNKDLVNLINHFKEDAQSIDKIRKYLDCKNIFDVFGITYSELVHSKILAWLLNPTPYVDHGLKDSFFELFLKKVIENYDKLSSKPTSFVISVEHSLGDDRKNRGRIDILLKSKLNGIFIAIENKILSTERDGQLELYETLLKEEFSGKEDKITYVFLTPAGIKASRINWKSLSYEDITEMLQKAIESSNTANEIVKKYLETLKSKIIWNKEIDQIWKEFYLKKRKKINNLLKASKLSQKDKEVLEYLQEYLNHIISELKYDFSSTIKQKPCDYIFHEHTITPKSYNFTSEIFNNLSIAKATLEPGSYYYDTKGIAYFEVLYDYKNSNKVEFYISIGPFKDSKMKNKLYTFLQKMNYKSLEKVEEKRANELTHWLILDKIELFNFNDFVSTKETLKNIRENFADFLSKDFKDIVVDLQKWKKSDLKK